LLVAQWSVACYQWPLVVAVACTPVAVCSCCGHDVKLAVQSVWFCIVCGVGVGFDLLVWVVSIIGLGSQMLLQHAYVCKASHMCTAAPMQCADIVCQFRVVGVLGLGFASTGCSLLFVGRDGCVLRTIAIS
jgi:hypothetical protein